MKSLQESTHTSNLRKLFEQSERATEKKIWQTRFFKERSWMTMSEKAPEKKFGKLKFRRNFWMTMSEKAPEKRFGRLKFRRNFWMTMSEAKGITLIALIVTIIILLILAGITIVALTGDNGLLNHAKNAKKLNEKANDRERIQLEILGSYGDDGSLSFETVKNNINENIPEAEVSGDDFPITVKLNGYSFEISSNGDVILKELVPTIQEVKVVINEDGTGDDISDYSQIELIDLYISFKAEIQGGSIKTVSCNDGTVEKKGDLYVTKISKNGTYKFTVVGTANEEDYTLNESLEVNKFSKRVRYKSWRLY